MPVLSRIFLVLSFLLLASQLVASLKGDVKFTSSDGGRRLVRFAFKNGGRASGSMTITTTSGSSGAFQLWLLKRNAYNQLFDVWTSADICADRSTFVADASWVFQISNNTGIQTWFFNGTVISGRGIYYLLYLNCAYDRVTVKFHYEVVNPGGNQLGWDVEPLPYFYIILVVFWFVALSLWVFNWIWHREQRPWLHRVISVYPVMKLVWVLYSTAYWWTLRKKGETSTFVYVLFVVLYVAQEVCLYFIFLLISTGWCISVDRIRTTYKIAIGVELLVLAGSLIAGILFSRYFSLLVILFYVIVLFCIFSWSRETLRQLDGSQAASSVGAAAVSPPTPASGASQPSAPAQGIHSLNKSTMISRFRNAMLSFVLCLLVWNFIIVLFLFDYVFIDTMFAELLSCGMAIAIGLIFRLRRENLYYLLSAEYTGGESSSNANGKAPAEFS